jgi:hypothetical protein
MRLYHGSNVIVDRPILVRQVRTLDFGSGFYTTTNRRQAIDFARKVMIRTKTDTQFVSVYEFDADFARQRLDILKFESPDEQWLDFVFQNRKGVYDGRQYDIIAGPVANDNVFTTLQLFEAGILTREQTLAELKIKQLYDQYTFASERSIVLIRYDGSFDAGEGAKNER